MHLCLFEDTQSRNFVPLAHFHPVYDLRCGMLSLGSRILRYLSPSSYSLHCRSYLASLVKEENPRAEVNSVPGDSVLFVNGRCVMDDALARILRKTKKDTIFVVQDEIVAAYLSGNALKWAREELLNEGLDFSSLIVSRVEVDATLVPYPWELVYLNETALHSDFALLTKAGRSVPKKGKLHRSVVLLGKKHIAVGKDSEIAPGVVIDASGGPVWIGNRVRVHPGAVIEGPCFIGDESVIKIGAKIYGNTSIGPVCKVGGEIDHAIMHSHDNKQHDGFLGHSYLGPWVNLGAGTTTSNLKNTYGNVQIQIGNRRVDSGRMFVGLLAGDHVKTGINMSLDTGTLIGPSSNLYGTVLPPKYIPAFSWGNATSLMTYVPEKAIEVATRTMARRGVALSKSYRDVFQKVFELTENERTHN